MPIRPEFRALYPAHWRELSDEIRFEQAGGACQRCGRTHGTTLKVLPDGRWFDPAQRTWRDGRGKPARWPDIEDAIRLRETRVVLATAHLDHNPRNNRRRNLRALCQRCHLIHDRPRHLRQRWITCRRRYALGDLFLGLYAELSRAVASARITEKAAGALWGDAAATATRAPTYPVGLTDGLKHGAESRPLAC